MNHRWKKIGLFLSLITVSLFLFTSCKESESTVMSTIHAVAPEETTVTGGNTELNPLDSLKITLPDGMERERVSAAQESFKKSDAAVGGIFLLECDDSVFEDVLGYADSLTTLVVKFMEANIGIGASEIEWWMGNSSVYGLHELNMGNDQSEWIAYVVRGNSACYVLWFDRKQVPYETETAIMQSLHSDDITDELNKISTEEFMEAISESMAQGDYRFEVTLPEGFTQKKTKDEGSLFYRDGQVIGGCKVIHFEKGILPAVHDNKELILTRLKNDMMDQIDLTDFHGEITDEELITAVFTYGSKEYTHYILSYGQIGTQYNLWLDTALLDKQTVDTIMWSAQLIEN